MNPMYSPTPSRGMYAPPGAMGGVGGFGGNNTASGGVRRGPSVPYLPGLDGLRALAVLTVIVYHANSQWMGGGFLGVEVFFVISGYLITLLLIAERERSGTVSLSGFWIRRARRLLPALFTLLIGIIVYCALFDRDRLGMLRGDVLGGFFYVSNWFQIWTGSSYTSDFAFAPLRHLWSLAVEEQFYIVWPVVMYVLLRRLRSRTLPVIGLWFTGLAIAIAVATAVIYRSGPVGTIAQTPEQYMNLFGRDVLRTDFLYLGTISRASGLLLGAALATVWRPWALARSRAGQSSAGLDAMGFAAVAALGYMCWRFRDVVVVTDGGEQAYDLLYRGGLFAVGVASVIAIAAVVHPRSALGAYVLGNPVFVWIGKRSYGLYLYHWTVFQVFRKSAGTALTGEEFVGLMLVTLALTEISYRLIETPIRTRGLLDTWAAFRERTGYGPVPLAATAMTAMLPVFAVVAMAGAKVIPDEITAGLDENEGAITSISTTTTVAGATTTVPGQSTTTTLGNLVPSDRMKVFAVGDSVMLGAAKKLAARGITVDAAKNRQVQDALPIFNYYKSVNRLGDFVVVHLGTNGTTRASTFDAILAPLAGVKNVIVLTVRVPSREYQEINNEIIRALPARYPNVRILDWQAASKGKKAWFSFDGTHLKSVGQDQYVALIAEAVGL